MNVSDADIGDTLTASVIGDTGIKYNNSTSLPGSAKTLPRGLKAASAVTFDKACKPLAEGSMSCIGPTIRTIPDLDFPEGRRYPYRGHLYRPRVNDGHGNVGSPGADHHHRRCSDHSADYVELQKEVVQRNPNVNGTPGDNVIHATSANDVPTCGAGGDQFVFTPQANSSSDTIGDFTPGHDPIDLRPFSAVVLSRTTLRCVRSQHDAKFEPFRSRHDHHRCGQRRAHAERREPHAIHQQAPERFPYRLVLSGSVSYAERPLTLTNIRTFVHLVIGGRLLNSVPYPTPGRGYIW